MRVLALDVGDERIGVAISDETGLLARPLTVVRRVAGKASFIEIKDLVERYQVEKMVVGLPLLPSGDEGDQVRSTRAYVRGMREHVDLDVVYVDERDTTLRAEEIMIQNQRSRRRRKQELDAVAAAVILQSYLDHGQGVVVS